ncbi:MAG: HAMP domain-containing histidine kinase [Oscillospiraceae bacterium]|nr:HAMP domain-containing histidine kinase [Oscillospiraceae bacterium]
MSSMRRNVLAWLLLLLAAFGWVYALPLARGGGSITGMTGPGVVESSMATAVPSVANTSTVPGVVPSSTEPVEGDEGAVETSTLGPTTVEEETPERSGRGRRLLGYLLCFSAAGAVAAGIFILGQKGPVLGSDGALLLLALLCWGGWFGQSAPGDALLGAAVLLALRELWGWLLGRLRLDWCLLHRLAGRCRRPQGALLCYAASMAAAAGVIVLLLCLEPLGRVALPVACVLGVGLLGGLCLRRYGADLHHFEQQLSCFQEGQAIAVGRGAFGPAEAQLQTIQTQHEEAVRRAVTSERFKVELISNVSHDLRTPLTSILGYGELLQGEALSPAGREQLDRLNRKAGYMRELVESLFELTKVSSGVVESRREPIDLLRLLEQTIGLFDDQLTAAGLTVRRHYGAETLPVITDGARMHQVFANLLGNAIKYALPGTRIHLEARATEGGVHVRMVNTASYEMDFRPEEILQRFARGDRARSTQGSGLGLAIAQTYTESVGGRFRVAVDGDQFSAIVTLPGN